MLILIGAGSGQESEKAVKNTPFTDVLPPDLNGLHFGRHPTGPASPGS
jgi:hypothetical protein